MESQRINIKLSKTQHNMLKHVSEQSGLTMTSWIQHMILNEYNRLNQLHQIPKSLESLQSIINHLTPEKIKELNQLGVKG